MMQENDMEAFQLPDEPNEREKYVVWMLRSANGGRAVEWLVSKEMMSPDLLLYFAAELNLVDLMVLLVEIHGANINGMVPRDGYSTTALIGAAEEGAAAATEWLLDHGADIEEGTKSPNGSFTALWGACNRGFLRTVRILLDHGANVDTYKKKTGNTALYIAAQNGYEGVCAELIRHGAQVELTMGLNLPPLAAVVARAQAPLVALFRCAGANVRPEYVRIVATMELLGKTPIDVNSRTVTTEEINVLKQLLSKDGIEKLRATVPENYSAAQELERKGDYREALEQIALAENALQRKIGPPMDEQAMWTQLLLDEKRLLTAVYGVPGSDGRVAAWHRHAFYETDEHPPPLMFYAWVKHDNVIYRHGGLFFLKQEQLPSLDVLWAFNMESKTWRQVRTTGATPGPRAGHVAVVYKGFMYVFGGTNIHGTTDTKLYRLDLSSFVWEAVKVKGLKPFAREASAGVVYKDKLYIYGGKNESYDFMNDLWCYSFETRKWKELTGRGGTPRGDHGMWAAQNKIYIMGGENLKQGLRSFSSPMDVRTILALEVFDLETKEWKSVRCVGDDPWELSEYTVLPLYRGQDEPSAIIVWGGYRHTNAKFGNKPPPFQEFIAKYGDEARDVGLPYRRRLLRFDLATQVWTLLKPLCEVNVTPTAQSFAAELSTKDNVTRLLIGGGYGLTGTSEEGRPSDPLDAALFEEIVDRDGRDPEKMVHPESRHEVFEVEILDERTTCFADRAAKGVGWEWELYDMPASRTLGVGVELWEGSPTMHLAMHVCDGDFADSPEGEVRDDDEDTVLGRRVMLRDLKSRSDLNGSIGRAGSWITEKGRYQVFVPKWERGGPCTVAVRSTNMMYAAPLPREGLGRVPMMRSPTPFILGSCCRLVSDERGPMDVILGLNEPAVESKQSVMLTDMYRGPLSSRADAILQENGRRPGNTNKILSLIYVPSYLRERATGGVDVEKKEVIKHALLYENFVAKLSLEDKPRVKLYETSLVSARDEHRWDEWLRVNVTIDGLTPSVERTLVLAPDITMQRLHHQVLCPAIGWTPNYHSYAFRRIYPSNEPMRTHQMRKPECWIGPRVSTSIDSFFQPLYIGAAVANDRKIFLGDLFEPDENGESKLQYVHDFGDWWSHTITLSRATDPPPAGTTVVYLESGSGSCPPEDCGGLGDYCDEMAKLSGMSPVAAEDVYETKKNESDKGECTDPSRPMWWKLLNSELRGKPNSTRLQRPLEFSLEENRQALDESLHRLVSGPGTEHEQSTLHTFSNGIAQSQGPQHRKEANPTDVCAVCGITAALKLCSGCKSVAFCSRAHQIDYWPQHKAACKAAQKNAKTGK